MKITDVKAIQILDSRGNPTLKVGVAVDNSWGYFSVPSGASTGVHEALELRDGKKAYLGLSVDKAAQNVLGPIREALLGQDPTNQAGIDQILIELDGTNNKSKLGANAILGASAATAKATSVALGKPLYLYLNDLFENEGHWQPELQSIRADYVLPKMYFNVLNGGQHADNNVDIQEAMIVPNKATVADNLRIATEVYHTLKGILTSHSLTTGLGDEGGFAPNLESNTRSLDLLIEAIKKAGYKPGKDVSIALDVAASEIFSAAQEDKYILGSENVGLTSQQMIAWYRELLTTYPIISIEDGLAEDDWDGWTMMTEKLGSKVQLVGDDLFVTNPDRIATGIEKKAGNAVLIKLNQIGSITETFSAIHLAVNNGYKCMISHRSGETSDTFIADLAVATGVGQIKSGAPARGERVAKYNRLVEIEQELISKK
jgi:enolase